MADEDRPKDEQNETTEPEAAEETPAASESQEDSKGSATSMSSEDLAAKLGVVADDDGEDLSEFIRAASQDLTAEAAQLSGGVGPWPPKVRKHTFAMIFGFILIISGASAMAAMEGTRDDWGCFLDGNIEFCKTAEADAKRKAIKERESKEANKAGRVELVYAPKTAQVTVTVQKFVESEEDYLERYARPHNDKRDKPVLTCEIDNDSLYLGEEETVEKISLHLPILHKLYEKSDTDKAPVHCKCSKTSDCESGFVCKRRTPDSDAKVCRSGNAKTMAKVTKLPVTYVAMASYRYHVKIEKEGYYPREFFFAEKSDVDKGPEGASPFAWQVFGADDTLKIEWPGADLVPHPETQKANFAKALEDIKCATKFTKDKDELKNKIQEIRYKNGFETEEEWQKTEAFFAQPEHAEWVKEVVAHIKKVKCEKPTE